MVLAAFILSSARYFARSYCGRDPYCFTEDFFLLVSLTLSKQALHMGLQLNIESIGAAPTNFQRAKRVRECLKIGEISKERMSGVFLGQFIMSFLSIALAMTGITDFRFYFITRQNTLIPFTRTGQGLQSLKDFVHSGECVLTINSLSEVRAPKQFSQLYKL